MVAKLGRSIQGCQSYLREFIYIGDAERMLAFLMPNRIYILQAHRITAVALHLGVFQGIVFFLREALW